MNEFLKNNKHIPAFTAALAITLVVGFALFAIGVEAVFNSRVDAVQAASSDLPVIDAQQIQDVQQLQELVTQYQAREQQYQSELQQAASQLNEAQAADQQYQAILSGLQNAGLIQITPDGQIYLNRGSSQQESAQGGSSEHGFFRGEHEEHEGGDD